MLYDIPQIAVGLVQVQARPLGVYCALVSVASQAMQAIVTGS